MATPLLLNLRVIENTEDNADKNQVTIALSHFGGAESGIKFNCSFNPSETAKWGCQVVELRGGPVSFFGNYQIQMNMLNELAQDGSEKAKAMLQDIVNQLQAFSSALSFLLNEWHEDESSSYVLPDDITSISESVIALNISFGELPGQFSVNLIKTGFNQTEVSLALANLSEIFNSNIPAHVIDGNNATGEIEDLISHVAKKGASSAH